MLVLTRHLDEAIRIGDGVIIKVLSIDSNNVKIGIEAPKSVPVFREEIYQRIFRADRHCCSYRPFYTDICCSSLQDSLQFHGAHASGR